jgi:hypothetical protein
MSANLPFLAQLLHCPTLCGPLVQGKESPLKRKRVGTACPQGVLRARGHQEMPRGELPNLRLQGQAQFNVWKMSGKDFSAPRFTMTNNVLLATEGEVGGDA